MEVSVYMVSMMLIVLVVLPHGAHIYLVAHLVDLAIHGGVVQFCTQTTACKTRTGTGTSKVIKLRMYMTYHTLVASVMLVDRARTSGVTHLLELVPHRWFVQCRRNECNSQKVALARDIKSQQQ